MKNKFIYFMALGAFLFSSCNSAEENEEVGEVKVTGEEYKLDNQKSTIRWFGEKLKDNAVVGSHNGTLKIKSGNILLDNKSIVGGSFEIDMNSMSEEINSEDRENAKESSVKLINHLKSEDFFETDKHPTATVNITGGTPEKIEGVIIMRGIEMNFEAPINLTIMEKRVNVAGVFDLDITPLNIPALGGSGEFISPKIGFRVYLEFNK